MHARILISFIVIAYVSAQGNDTTCVTPNGEIAVCRPVWLCKAISHAITYRNKDAVEFVKKSRCGKSGGLLVCCGSIGHFFNSTTTNGYSENVTASEISTEGTIISNEDILILDHNLCGLKIPAGTVNLNINGIGEYPWIAALKYAKGDDGSDFNHFRCSGTLIGQKYVLTAATCLSIPGYNLIAVRLGESLFPERKDCFNGKEGETCRDAVFDVPVVNTIIHPYYNTQNSENNIALLLLERTIYYSDYICPLCLPPFDLLTPQPGTLLDITGLRHTENEFHYNLKLNGQIPFHSQENCRKILKNDGFGKYGEACAGGDSSVNACFGDIGGPIIKAFPKTDENQEKRWYQEGVVYEKRGCEENETSFLIYSRISNNIEWIVNNIKHHY